MPMASAMDKLMSALTAERIKAILEEQPEVLDRLRGQGSGIEVAKELAGLDDKEAAYIEDIPMTLREGVRAALVEAASAGKAVHLQYSPGYDFSVQMWDYGEGLSVHLSGPYPPSYARDAYQEHLRSQA
jgi:hypothetical protein